MAVVSDRVDRDEQRRGGARDAVRSAEERRPHADPRRGRRRARQRLPDHEGFHRESSARARIIDTPIAEASIVGIAVGMAMEGLAADRRDSVRRLHLSGVQPDRRRGGQDALSFATASTRVRWSFARRTAAACAARSRTRSRSRRCSITCPGLKIVAPSFPADIKGLLNAAIDDPDPVLFLEHKKTYRLDQRRGPERPLHDSARQGQRPEGRHAADRRLVRALRASGARRREAARRRRPLGRGDRPALDPADGQDDDSRAASQKTRKLLIIHEDNKFGGIGAEISAMVAEEALFDLDAPIRRLCGPDVPAMGYALPLEEEFMSSTGARWPNAMRELVKF